MGNQRARMPNSKPKRKRKPGEALVESFRLEHVQLAAMIPGDPDLPKGLDIEVPQVQLVLIGRPAFLLGDAPAKHYLTFLDAATAIGLGPALAEAGQEAQAAIDNAEQQTDGGVILGSTPAQAAAEAAAAAEREAALRKGTPGP